MRGNDYVKAGLACDAAWQVESIRSMRAYIGIVRRLARQNPADDALQELKRQTEWARTRFIGK